jgi:hypothetical protein
MNSQQVAGTPLEHASASTTPNNPTPPGIVARFAELPSYLPPRVVRLPDGLKLGNIDSGDLIAVNGRWTTVLRCSLVNHWVTLHLDMVGQRPLTAHESTSVHLARRERSRVPAAMASGV